MPRRPDVPCANCGTLMWRGRGSLAPGEATCRACRAKQPKELRRQMAACALCGTPFVPVMIRGRRQETCSRRCATLRRYGHAAPEDPVLLHASRRAANIARCARRRGSLVVVEAVEPLKVFERDGWRCHLCGKRIDRRLSGRVRMGPTLDHLVPVSQGGEHSYANVRAAHRACNSGRGVGGAVQLALIG